jgi:two-component system chemotaxis response regulator CheY
VKALIVDDSRTIRMLLGRILRELGFDTAEAGDGQCALEVLRARRDVDLMLVDWNMPVMDGYELLCALKADGSFRDLRILMVTTETEISQVERALAAGANEYLMKPFSREAVEEKLALLGLGAAS